MNEESPAFLTGGVSSWLRDNLLEHQQAVEKLIKLIDSLLNR